MKGTVLLLSTQESLIQDVEGACARRGIRLLRGSSTKESPRSWGGPDGEFLGVLADSRSLREKERWRLIELHRPPQAPQLVFLDPDQASYPVSGKDKVPRLAWPLREFPESGPAAVFLADATLITTGLLRRRLDSAGLAEARIELWSGDVYEVDVAQRAAERRHPGSRVFLVDSRSPVHAAEHALRIHQPAFLPNKLFEEALELLAGRPALDPLSLGRILILDRSPDALSELSADLMERGYEVAAFLDPEEALKRAFDHRLHLAIVDSAAGGGTSGIEVARKLRWTDPDLRVIVTIQEDSLEAALDEIGQALAAGLDDCLLRPVEPSRLEFSIRRALERRRLRLANEAIARRLRETNQDLEARARFQSRLFAMVAHDVKNPLVSVMTFAGFLAEKAGSPQLKEYAGHIESSSRALSDLVSDLMDYAAMESGKLRVELLEADLGKIVGETAARLKLLAAERGVAFSVSVPEGLPAVRADPLRIGQVVQNLGANAIQYTPSGGSVSLSAKPGPGGVTVTVQDTGVGIGAEDLPRIFQRFFQSNDAQTLRRAGFGLGLTIASEIVKAHGGEIQVESAPGKGSTFRFTLPALSSD